MRKLVLEDASGLYRLDCAVSIHPLTVKGDARDQSKVTAVHTGISTIGGQTHHTNIPFDKARAAFLALFDEPAQQPPQKPKASKPDNTDDAGDDPGQPE